MAQWNQALTDMLCIALPLPYSSSPPDKRSHPSPRVGFCLWRCLFGSSTAPHCLTGTRALGQRHQCWSERKMPLPELAPVWRGICDGLRVFSGALQSSNGLTWCHLGSLVGWWGFFDLVSLQHEKVWLTPIKVSWCDPCSWSFLSERNGRKIMCQSVLLHVQLCVFLNNASAERLNMD